jgi:hypothetical protein
MLSRVFVLPLLMTNLAAFPVTSGVNAGTYGRVLSLPTQPRIYGPLEFAVGSARLSNESRQILDDIWIRLINDKSVCVVACSNAGVGVPRTTVRRRLQAVSKYLSAMSAASFGRRYSTTYVPGGAYRIAPSQVISLMHDGVCSTCGAEHRDSIGIFVVVSRQAFEATGLTCPAEASIGSATELTHAPERLPRMLSVVIVWWRRRAR